MKTLYSVREYEGDTPCIHPLAMAELLIRINNKTPRYKGLGKTPQLGDAYGLGYSSLDMFRNLSAVRNVASDPYAHYYYPPKHN